MAPGQVYQHLENKDQTLIERFNASSFYQIQVQSHILSNTANAFGLTKAVSDTIFDMIVTTYHDKPLIFSGATFPERFVTHHWPMRDVVCSLLMQRSDKRFEH